MNNEPITITFDAYQWLLTFCLKNIWKALENQDWERAVAFSKIGTTIGECWDELNEVET